MMLRLFCGSRPRPRMPGFRSPTTTLSEYAYPTSRQIAAVLGCHSESAALNLRFTVISLLRLLQLLQSGKYL
jgi:hypothetical protein